uniref:Uncharacterized protein n=1 Tax=Rhizophora mucronata TaxID=61149 RepID=A0A2P2NYY9_RHIMU
MQQSPPYLLQRRPCTWQYVSVAQHLWPCLFRIQSSLHRAQSFPLLWTIHVSRDHKNLWQTHSPPWGKFSLLQLVMLC